MSNGGSWSQMRERGSLAGLRFTLACYRSFGRAVSLPVVHGVVAYFFATDGAGRRASLAYLRRAHRAGAFAPTPDLWQSFLHYRAFALSIFDRLSLWLGRSEEYEFHFEGRSNLTERERGRGAIVIGAHLGSFDAMRVMAVKNSVPVNVLMFTKHAPRINTLFRELSPDSEMRVLPVEDGAVNLALRVRDRIEAGELVAMLGDRVEPGAHGRTVRVRLLGDEVEIPQAPFLLALTLRCRLVLMVALRRGDRRYDLHAELLANPTESVRRTRETAIAELAQHYADRLEAHLRTAPEQWFNFYDYWGELEADPSPRGDQPPAEPSG